jgi:superfamily I DNA/RNA helicase
MELIANGIKAKIKGRDFAKNLISLIENKLKGLELDMDEFDEKLENYYSREMDRLQKRDMSTQTLEDTYMCIKKFSEGARNPKSIVDKINRIFDDESTQGVILSSVHKAKGLEADRIFLLYPEMMPLKKYKKPWNIYHSNCIK